MRDKPIGGIDVSKGWLDVCVAGGAGVERIANNAEAVAAWLDRIGPGLVAFEPTGGHERILIEGLRERGVSFIRVHPNDVIAFRKSRGIKAKSDPIDARLILAFLAEELSRRGWRSSVIGDDLLRALAARRRQLVEALQAERCRLALAAVAAVRQAWRRSSPRCVTASMRSRPRSPRSSPAITKRRGWPSCCRPSMALARSPPPR
jgi:transposase